MTGFDVDKLIAAVEGAPRRRDEIVHQPIEFSVRQDANAVRKATIQHRVSRASKWLGSIMHGRPRVASRMGQLQSDPEIAVRVGAEAFTVRIDRLVAQRRDRRLRRRRHQQLMRIGPAILTDATASPPQINFAPLMPKWRHRRRVRSVGSPSGVPSHPSIGRMLKRLPIRVLPTVIDCASGESVPPAIASSKARGIDDRSRCARNADAVFSEAIRG